MILANLFLLLGGFALIGISALQWSNECNTEIQPTRSYIMFFISIITIILGLILLGIDGLTIIGIL